MLTIASIVQRKGREGGVEHHRGGLLERVDEGMLLNADPTTQYAVAQSPDWWPVLRLDPIP